MLTKTKSSYLNSFLDTTKIQTLFIEEKYDAKLIVLLIYFLGGKTTFNSIMYFFQETKENSNTKTHIKNYLEALRELELIVCRNNIVTLTSNGTFIIDGLDRRNNCDKDTNITLLETKSKNLIDIMIAKGITTVEKIKEIVCFEFDKDDISIYNELGRNYPVNLLSNYSCFRQLEVLGLIRISSNEIILNVYEDCRYKDINKKISFIKNNCNQISNINNNSDYNTLFGNVVRNIELEKSIENGLNKFNLKKTEELYSLLLEKEFEKYKDKIINIIVPRYLCSSLNLTKNLEIIISNLDLTIQTEEI